ncbi:MAG: hypothetical protein V7676_05340 [Parasphingorhabdus sp.]|uniref:hypothetical protein n=1 Tax=Parasphingorhabdus sp. TaxID=2709688 RepID=UPI0030029695
MTSRKYFSARSSNSAHAPLIDLPVLKALVLSIYEYLQSNGYFDEAFGFTCVDEGEVEGTVGNSVNSYVLITIMKKDMWPISEKIDGYSEPDLFDMIEFLFDHVSEPKVKNYHGWNDCGYHYSEFNKVDGQGEYRQRINKLLERYDKRFTLNERGEIMALGSIGLNKLFTAKLPTDEITVTDKVENAVERFQRYSSSVDDRQKAVRDLADVLEWLRPQIKITLLKQDEKDLFQLANNFGIRHLNQKQKLDYDKAIWLSWIFYHYLATINACLHLIKRQKVK